MDDFLPDYEASGWLGIGAPRDIDTEIVEKLNAEINAVLADPQMKARLLGMGIEPTPTSAAEFGKFIAAETDKWAKVVKFADIKPN
jgi:tripartite-type tricarboxylate transporter receptor subunit TctC